MISSVVPSTYSCFLNIHQVDTSFENLDNISSEEFCPHIRKCYPEVIGYVDLYVIMDSNCYQHQQNLQGLCDKKISNKLRVIAKKDVMHKGSAPIFIKLKLTLYHSQALKFEGGKQGEHFHTLDYEPLVIAPIYTKVGKPNTAVVNFDIQRQPATSSVRVPLQVDGFINENGFSESEFYKQGWLEIFVPEENTERVEVKTEQELEVLLTFLKLCQELEISIILETQNGSKLDIDPNLEDLPIQQITDFEEKIKESPHVDLINDSIKKYENVTRRKDALQQNLQHPIILESLSNPESDLDQINVELYNLKEEILQIIDKIPEFHYK